MNKLKKLAVMIMVAAMSASAFAATASAKQVVPFEGGQLVIYEEGDEIPALSKTRASMPIYSFNQTFSGDYMEKLKITSSGETWITVPAGTNRVIRVSFTKKDSFCNSLYGNKEGKYIVDKHDAILPASVMDYKLDDSSVASSYFLEYGGINGSVTLAGTVTSASSLTE